MGLIQQCGQIGQSPLALSYGQLGSCAVNMEGNVEFAGKKSWDLQKTFDKVKGAYPSAQRQHRTGFHGKKISMKPTNLKVRDEARLEDSMPPLPQATDEALPDESWPIWEHANSMPSLEDDGNKTLATQNQKIPGVGGPTFNKLLAARDGEDVVMEISTESDETHSYAEGTKVIFKGLTALQYNGQVGKIL